MAFAGGDGARTATRSRKRARVATVALALALGATSTAGCRPLYVARVGMQHLRYMTRAKPIESEIAHTKDPVRRRKLELVLAAREFANANGLDPAGSYLKVSDTEGLSAGFVVTAALQDRLEPYLWTYPVIGEIPYRGYFKREEADAFAAEMAELGYDTYVFPAAGYSTLGWFDDPLPSGLLFYDDVTLVDVVIHELLHQNVYVGSEIEFNETLASAVSKRLTPAFFEGRGEALEAAAAENAQRLWLAQSDVFDEFAARLQRYFEEPAGRDRAAMLAGRAAIYADLEERLRTLQPPGSPDLETEPIVNNAVFLALWRYRKQASLIERYLASFPDVSAAIADLREQAEREGDPYAFLAQRLEAAVCCSGRIVVSFLGSFSRRAADTIDEATHGGRGPGGPNTPQSEGGS